MKFYQFEAIDSKVIYFTRPNKMIISLKKYRVLKEKPLPLQKGLPARSCAELCSERADRLSTTPASVLQLLRL